MTDRNLDIVKEIVLTGLAGCRARVYLFGSRASGTAGPRADIDVAVDPLAPIPSGVLSRIRENLEESSTPYVVDLVDLTNVSPEFKKEVIDSGVEWTD